MTVEAKIQLVDKYARGKESGLVERYIADGPTILKEKMRLSDEQWRVIFDYLVFEHNLLYKTVISSADFFVQEYVKHGMNHIRHVLDAVEVRYDGFWDLIFDYLAIANEGLYYHVLEHRQKYMAAFREHGSEFVRKVLGVASSKYEENWEKILDFMLKSVCDDIVSEQTFDHSIKAFSRLMNNDRPHRPIFKSGILPF